MMNKLFGLLFIGSLLFVFTACDNDEDDITTLPQCIEDIIDNEDENTTEPLISVQVQKVNDEFHYWLNTNSRYADGCESIVNNNCEPLCCIGGLLPQDCLNDYDYDSGDWQIIWER